VDQEPRHRVVFSTPAFRVLEVHVPPRDTTLEHRHDFDLLTVNIENGPTRTRDRGADWGAVRPRSVGGANVSEYTGKSMAHVVQSVGDRAYRLTGVENLRNGGWTTLPPVAGRYLTVVNETRAFRAYDLHLPPGGESAHRHAVPVVVTLVDGVAEVDGGSRATLATPGAWRVLDPDVLHTVRTRERSAHVVEVEVR
jgi:quercetin dioxygenase-like cupin family protein